ncbi:sensor histidine kinase [Paucidesulfovibrio longus]|uniref:sensor histidine kinase n=1 Tax=Paucidesulfovibrio longus TaxID=889 RepID=UPI0003B4AEDC|nr:sensor histidine kinase [Paucidesulfovibrio longus]
MGEMSGFKAECRSSQEEIAQQFAMFEKHVCFPFIDALPGGVFILNTRREIVYLHPRSAHLVTQKDINSCLGMRVGEALGCVNALEGENGCHTSRFCTYCGAVKALDGSEKYGQGREECNLLRQTGERVERLNLEVLAVRVENCGDNYFVFSVEDRSEAKELSALERFFFHDVLNLAGGVRSMLEMFEPQLSAASENASDMLMRAANRLVNEIVVQKKLCEALRDEMPVASEMIRSSRIGEDLIWLYQAYWPNGPRIQLDEGYESVMLESDRALLERVLGNMIKNAAEASKRDQVVALGCNRTPSGIRFWVRNEGVLEDHVRNQLFRNSFSTKSKNRGLGTQSMKLLGERYLGGKVGFDSSKQHGTVFYLELPSTC